MQRLGPYTLLQRIGAGGMAEIFLARKGGPGGIAKVVAVKRILPHLASFPDFVAMFLDEAQLAARLSHPHIAQIYDFGQADGTYYIAMEYVPGEDVLTIIRRGRELGIPTPAGAAAAILAAACDALHHAHEQHDEHGRPLGIVHRDVTPSNLIVSHEGVVKLVDFGIAKAERRLAVTAAGALKGKYAYMSPEHALGHPVDRRSDVFSLGIVGYELVTQRRLFHRESELAVLRAITEEPIPRADDKRPDMPPELADMLALALERDPNRRYPTAQALQLDLVDFLAARSAVTGQGEVQSFMRRLFGAEDVARRHRQAAGELEDAGPGTEAFARPPSAPPEEATLGGNRARAVSVFDEALGTPPERGVATEHIELPPHVRPQRRARRLAVLLIAGAVAIGGLWLAVRPGASDANGTHVAPSPSPGPDLPPVGPTGPSALDAPRFDQPGRKVASPVQRPDKPHEGEAIAWLAIDGPAQMQVLLDGEPLGMAPIARRKVPAGLHTITVTGPLPGATASFALDLPEGAQHLEMIRIDSTGTITHQEKTP